MTAFRGSDLEPDCARCSGLCCVALPFARGADFPVDKPAGQPCAHLRTDHACGVHADLRGRGFRGCTVYDCFGAGQRVTQVTFGGGDWRTTPQLAGSMFAVFPVVRQLHELLRYVTEALGFDGAAAVHAELTQARTHVEALAGGTPAEILALDVDAMRGEVNPLLLRASELTRAGRPGPARNLRGADLVGADLRGTDLRAASLRGALLVAADLRGSDLTGADVIGADLRDADLRGADLTDALFLTGSQLMSARGDAGTVLPDGPGRPAHWPT